MENLMMLAIGLATWTVTTVMASRIFTQKWLNKSAFAVVGILAALCVLGLVGLAELDAENHGATIGLEECAACVLQSGALAGILIFLMVLCLAAKLLTKIPGWLKGLACSTPALATVFVVTAGMAAYNVVAAATGYVHDPQALLLFAPVMCGLGHIVWVFYNESESMDPNATGWRKGIGITIMAISATIAVLVFSFAIVLMIFVGKPAEDDRFLVFNLVFLAVSFLAPIIMGKRIASK